MSFANPKLHEAKQFSKNLSKSLDPTAYPVQIFYIYIYDIYIIRNSIKHIYLLIYLRTFCSMC
jgi:hypothetical protein